MALQGLKTLTVEQVGTAHLLNRLTSVVHVGWKLHILLHHLRTAGVHLPPCCGVWEGGPAHHCGHSATRAPAAKSLQQSQREICEGVDRLVT